MRKSVPALVMVLLASVCPAPPGRAAERAIVEVVIDPDSGRPRFEPEILFIEPGDSVLFRSAGNSYASRAIADMQPEAADPWWGQLGRDLVVTFTEPGVYGHKCAASYRLGLVGLIVVGDDPPANMTSARSVPHPPLAAANFRALFDQLDRHYPEK